MANETKHPIFHVCPLQRLPLASQQDRASQRYGLIRLGCYNTKALYWHKNTTQREWLVDIMMKADDTHLAPVYSSDA